MRSLRTPGRCLAALVLCLPLAAGTFPLRAIADPAATPKAEPAKAGVPIASAEPETGLPVKQEIVSRRYKRFEETLLKLSEALRKTDPDRADLLRRAVGRSKESQVAPQLAELVELLKKDQFGEALDRQQTIVAQMQALLDLLLSEDRAKEITAERKRIEGYLKDLNTIIAGQKDNRAATERGDPIPGLQDRQVKLANRTGDLGKKIDRDDEAKRAKGGDSKPKDPKGDDPKSGDPKSGDPKSGDPKSGDPKSGEPKAGDPKDPKGKDPKPGDPKSGEPKPGDSKDPKGKDPKSGEPKPGDPKSGDPKSGEPKPGDPKAGDPKSGEPKPGDPKAGDPKSGEPKPGDPKSGDPKSGDPKSGDPQSGEQKQNQKSTPGRENLEQARREMEKALKNLQKQDRSQSSNDQEEALRELQKAKEKFEEILRQLREEERLRLLAALEARFQRMLAMQLLVYDGTVKLDKIPAADRGSQHAARSLQLARQEEEIVLEANKALTLLKEDGTAVAFPEAAGQMRDDMQQVVGRLERTDVAALTQSIEKDIIAALEEMIEALQKEMEKREQQKQKNQQQQQQQEQDKSLIEQLAELKMLRSLQLRINHRTKRIGRMVQGEQATDNDLLQQLQILGHRQSRVQQATFNLATGRNQ